MNVFRCTYQLWLRVRRSMILSQQRLPRQFHQLLTFLVFWFALSELAPAYVLEPAYWKYSPVNVRMELSPTAGSLISPPSFPLYDGSTSWEQVYAGAAEVWNGVMANLQLTTSVSPAVNPGAEDVSTKPILVRASPVPLWIRIHSL
jgi:hypothetical protein